jgi:hypothetical protein
VVDTSEADLSFSRYTTVVTSLVSVVTCVCTTNFVNQACDQCYDLKDFSQKMERKWRFLHKIHTRIGILQKNGS